MSISKLPHSHNNAVHRSNSISNSKDVPKSAIVRQLQHLVVSLQIYIAYSLPKLSFKLVYSLMLNVPLDSQIPRTSIIFALRSSEL
jgi:hypothetical protein